MSIIGSGVATEIARSLSGIDVHIVRDPAGLSQSAIKRKSKFDRIKNRGTLSKIRGAPEWDDEHRAMAVGVSIETGSTMSQDRC
jgi:hypothetical protein